MSISFWVWIVLLVIAVIAEAATVALVSIWFIPGMVVALILNCVGVQLFIQILAFAVISVVCLILTKPLVKKLRINKETNTNKDSLLEREFVVTKAVPDEFSFGSIKVGDVEWAIASLDKGPIAEKEVIVVKEIKGNTLYVKKRSVNVE